MDWHRTISSFMALVSFYSFVCSFVMNVMTVSMFTNFRYHLSTNETTACQCVKLQLQQLGFDTEFLPCQIQVKESSWDGVRRKYWHGRDTYYLPRATWNPQFLQNGSVPLAVQHDGKNKLSPTKEDSNATDEMEVDTKRPRM